MFTDESSYTNPVSGDGWLTTPRAAAVIVLGALLFLILVRRGFRGVSALGMSVSVK